MKKWVLFLGVLACLLIGGYFIMSLHVLKQLQSQLEKKMGPGWTLSDVKVKLTHLSVGRVHLEDSRSRETLLEVEKIKIYPSLVSLLEGPLRIREITVLGPSFFFNRSQEGIFSGPWVSLRQDKEKEGIGTAPPKEKGKGEPFSVQVDRVRIQEGIVRFEDQKAGRPPARIGLRELDLEVRDIRYPFASTRSLFTLKGKIDGGSSPGNIALEGWIDPATQDFETSLKIDGMEIKTLEPYYRKRVSARIEDGKIRGGGTIQMEKKRVDVQGQLELFDFRMQEEGTVFRIPAKDLVPLLERRGNSVKVPFQVKGNMEDPEFNLQEALLTRVAFSLASSLGLPVGVVRQGNGEGKGAEKLIQGLQSIEEWFKKKKEK